MTGRRAWLTVASLLVLAATAVLGVVLARSVVRSPGPWVSVSHGRYLARAGDCESCHTASASQPWAGGRAVPTPFGTIYSTNITPDKDTGIGRWDDDDFYRAMHEGIDRQGRHLYPAFPYPWFTKLSREDVHDIKAYLDTRIPVRQENRAPDLPWPLSVRGAMAVWNQLYFDEGTFHSEPDKSDQWNRGAYLVQGAGHCSACHGAKNFAGAVDKDHPLGGGHAENVFAPALTADSRAGLGRWSAQDIADYLGSGRHAGEVAAGPMTEVVEQSTQYLTEPDRRAIAVYLKSFATHGEKSIESPDRQAMSRGSQLYTDNCECCHLRSGMGEANAFPALKGSSAVQATSPDTLVAVILQGGSAPATSHDPTGLTMPAFDSKLDDGDIAQLTTYVRNAWGNRGSTVSADDVHDLREKLRNAPP